MNYAVIAIAVLVLSVLSSILLGIFVVPEKSKDNLSGFFLALHNIFNFKSLLIEKILKALYILSTMLCIFGGIFIMFAFAEITGSYDDNAAIGGIVIGLLAMILGPIAIRLIFESLMMFILLVKNTIQINNKLKDQNAHKCDEKTETKTEVFTENNSQEQQ